MKRIILTIMAVMLGVALSYAESCEDSGLGKEYKADENGCGYQTRACCSGQWCSWGTSTCASCTATSTTNSRNCSGNVTNACAGTQTQSCTRSVTASCGSSCTYGSCSYGSWSNSGCSYTQSCTATSESKACSSVSSSYCSGTATRSGSKSCTTASCGSSCITSCGGCSWGGWNTSRCLKRLSCYEVTSQVGPWSYQGCSIKQESFYDNNHNSFRSCTSSGLVGVSGCYSCSGGYCYDVTTCSCS